MQNYWFNFYITMMLVFAFAHSAFAQTTGTESAQNKGNTNSALPKIIILPWQTPLVDPDFLRLTRKARTNVTNKLKETFIPTGLQLDKLTSENKVSALKIDDFRNVWVDQTTDSQSSIALIPIWTRVHDHHFVGLLTVDAFRNTIKFLTHNLLPNERWLEAVKSNNFDGFFGQEFIAFSAAINPNNLQPSPEDLAVAFRDQTVNVRQNEIDRLTLSTMIGYTTSTQKQSPAFTVLNPFANELLTSIQKRFGVTAKMRKPNRIIFTRIPYEKTPRNAKLPITLTMGVSAAESVFGKTIPATWTEPLIVGIKTDGTLELTFSNRIAELLIQEKIALKRDDLPQVVKIRGAWAYVDKGRAWGLQMNDRLVIADGSGTVKGHVVGYFGPEMKLKSPRGFSINEGAIVFIRKGQKNVKEGQMFAYDKTTVPSP